MPAYKLKTLVTVLITAVTTLTAAVLIGFSWHKAKQGIASDAARNAAFNSELIQARGSALLLPALAAMRQISFDTVTSVETETDRWSRSVVLYEELRLNPSLDAVHVTYADGSSLQAVALGDNVLRAALLAPADATQAVWLRRANGELLQRFVMADGQLGEIQRAPVPLADGRTLPYYGLARVTGGSLSDPYPLNGRQVQGLTLVQRAPDNTAVVGFDLRLSALEPLLAGWRVEPTTVLALVNAEGRVLAAAGPEMEQVARWAPVAGLDDHPLALLHRQAPALNVPLRVRTQANGEWLAQRLNLNWGLGQPLVLLKATPLSALQAPMMSRLASSTWISLGLLFLILPLAWFAGRTLGLQLHHLSSLSARVARFNFSATPPSPSLVSEVQDLQQSFGRMSLTIESFLSMSETMALEPSMERMLEQTLASLTAATHARCARVWVRDAQSGAWLEPVSAGAPGHWVPSHQPGHAAPHAALYRNELKDRSGELVGELVLEMPSTEAAQDASFQDFARRLSGMLAVAIEVRQLIASQRQLFDGVIRMMADAIDTKSPYTGGHCDRVPRFAIDIMERLAADPHGRWTEAQLSESDRYAFTLGAWLHDCGKVTSAEHIVDKATKLELIYNRIHEVRMRFEVLWRDAQIKALTGELDASALAAQHQQLQEEYAFIAQCNVGGEFLSDAAVQRLQEIGQRRWRRHFDDRLGLSRAEERQLMQVRPDAPELPAIECLLADKPEHQLAWHEARRPAVERGDPRNHHGFDMDLPAHEQNQGELYNLGVRRGTLTAEDRFRINDHMVQTFKMLNSLPWPRALRRVPELAATHHERLDGQGYPRRLTADQLSLSDRVLAIADVFEALTAADRPYKPPKSLQETLSIMASMCGPHLDGDLFRYFLRERLWADLAERHLGGVGIDGVDVAAIEARWLEGA